MSERGGVDFYSGLLHAGEDGDERQVYFFVELGQPCLFDIFPQRSRQPAGDVGGFGEIAAELEIEAAESHVCQAM